MSKFRFRHPFVALLLLVAMLCQGTWALAGTTGNLSGVVLDNNGAALANAKVSVVSPSQSNSTTTDASGHFVFLSLAPDAYTVAVEKQGYDPVSVAGVSVFADQTQNLTLRTGRTIREIGRVTSRATSDIVRPGTTADVYSVNAARQETVQSMGGGGNLDNAYSAIASVPGTYVPPNTAGWGVTIYIRGSSYSQIGYEFDGIPVNRAFDNYQATTNSNLGQQELQVYTGGAPAGAASQTLTGFINQVIKTGTYPGFANFQLGVGSPTFYHKAQVEIGGATPNRNFSYYLAASGANQSLRYFSQFNGAPADQIPQGLQNAINGSQFNGAFGGGVQFCTPGQATWSSGRYSSANPPPGGDPGCFGTGPLNIGAASDIQDRENIVNLHFGIPHKRDGGKDDIQLLYAVSSLHTQLYGSLNDYGGPSYAGAYAAANTAQAFTYQDTYVFPNTTSFGQSANGLRAVPYYFPNTSTNRPFAAAIPNDIRDGNYNDSATIKLQYQHNIGSSAFLRAYGYLFYSDWLISGPTSSAFDKCCFGAGASNTLDYELDTHTRGGELQYSNQINSKNLVTFTANYTTASVMRFNNATSRHSTSTTVSQGRAQSLSRSNTATSYADASGNCYAYATGALANCWQATTQGSYLVPTPGTAPAGSAAALAGANWIVTVPNEQGTYNTVAPKFTSLSLTDQWKPTDKLLFNLGVRYENFLYKRQNQTGPENQFWFNAAQNAFCYDLATKQVVVQPSLPGQPISTTPFIGTTCPNSAVTNTPTVRMNGQNGAPLFGVGVNSDLNATFVSPRFGMTYTINPDTVIRIAAGQQVEPANTASTQYLDKSGRRAALFNAASFINYGYNAPNHDQQMQVGRSVDLSLEKHVKGTDISWKLTPFYRWSAHQLTSQIIGPNFITAFNDSNQRTMGFELGLTKGDTTRDGLAYGLSYSYTFARQYWLASATGTNRMDIINTFIDGYNALTSAGNRFGVRGAPCYASSGDGTPDPNCGPTSVRNPYFNQPAQPLLNPTQGTIVYPNYPPFQPSREGPADTIAAFPPHVLTAWASYKRNKWVISPNVQFTAGQQYGSPLAASGLDPRFCTQNSAGAGITAVSPSTDPLQANWLSCGYSSTPGGLLAVPNPYNGRFDGLGTYREPSQIDVSLQMTYDFTPKVKGTLILANLYQTCFGGTAAPWTAAFPANTALCAYGSAGGSGLFAGNFIQGTGYNDTAANGLTIPQNFRYPYTGLGGNYPFNAYFRVDIKI